MSACPAWKQQFVVQVQNREYTTWSLDELFSDCTGFLVNVGIE